jgi:hypothetical protein
MAATLVAQACCMRTESAALHSGVDVGQLHVIAPRPSTYLHTAFPKAHAPTMKEAALYMHHAEKDPQEAKKIAHDTASRECYPAQWLW